MLYDPTRLRRVRSLQGHSRHLRVPTASFPRLSPQTGEGPVEPRPPLLGRGLGVRPGVPRAPHCAAQARDWRRSASRSRASQSTARSDPPAVGGLHHRGPRQRPGPATSSFAMYLKIHRSAIDGATGDQIVEALHDLTPRPVADQTVDSWRGEAIPSPFVLLGKAYVNALRQPRNIVEFIAQTVGTRSMERTVAPTQSSHAVEGKTRFNARHLTAPRVRWSAVQPDPGQGSVRTSSANARSTTSCCASSVAPCVSTCERRKRNCRRAR